MSTRPGSKQTEIGEIPQEWKVEVLGRLVEYEKGKTPRKIWEEEKADTLPYLGIQTLRTGMFSQWVNETNSLVRVNSDDIIIVWDGFYSGEAFVGFKGILSSTAVKTKPTVAYLDGKFLYYFLKSRFKELNSKHTGMYLKHVSKAVFESLKVSVPPLPEQRKISSILSTVDEAIQKTDEIITKTQLLKKGLMQQLLTIGIGHRKFRQTEIGQIPDSWGLLSIFEMKDPSRPAVKTGPFGSQLKRKHFRPSGVPVINISALGDGKIANEGLFYIDEEKANQLGEYALRPGDIVFSRVAEVGRSVVIPLEAKGWIISSNLIRVSVDLSRFDPNFLMYSLTGSPILGRQILALTANAGREIMSSRILGAIKFPMPMLDEQKKISEIITASQLEVESEMKERNRLMELRKGLMHDLLSGKVRVKVN